jgi:DNA (cytosine-5)-methyltransferase 1
MQTTLGKYIRAKRKKLGFPLKTVASHIKIDPSTLSKIEKDERYLHSDYIDKLSVILQLDKKELLNYHYSTKILNELDGMMQLVFSGLKLVRGRQYEPNRIIRVKENP